MQNIARSLSFADQCTRTVVINRVSVCECYEEATKDKQERRPGMVSDDGRASIR